MPDFIPFPNNLRTTSPTQGVSTVGMQVGQDIKVNMLASSADTAESKSDTDTTDLVVAGTADFLGQVSVVGPKTGTIGTNSGDFTATYSGTADPGNVTYTWTTNPTTLLSPSGNTMSFTPTADTPYQISCTFTDGNSSDSPKTANVNYVVSPETPDWELRIDIPLTDYITTGPNAGTWRADEDSMTITGTSASEFENTWFTGNREVKIDHNGTTGIQSVSLFGVTGQLAGNNFIEEYPNTTIKWDVAGTSSNFPLESISADTFVNLVGVLRASVGVTASNTQYEPNGTFGIASGAMLSIWISTNE